MAVLIGGSMSQTLTGGADDDLIQGKTFKDTLYGNGGDDTIYGGAQDDLIVGDDNTPTGGGGSGGLGGPIGSNLVVNASFEDGTPTLNPGELGYFAGLPGWNIASGPYLEVQWNFTPDPMAVGVAPGRPSFDGNKAVELDTEENSAYAQDVATGGDGSYLLEFEYAPRPTFENESSGFQVLWNGVVVDTILSPSSPDWTHYEYTVAGGGAATDNLEFRAIGTSDRHGAMIDLVSVRQLEELPAGNTSNDALYGETGHDTIYGGYGEDSIYGGEGKDSLFGQDGNDYIDGDNGNDLLNGGSGNDTLTAGGSNDVLIGGAGADVLTGGSGNDLFTFTSKSDSTTAAFDVITDFNKTLDDIDVGGLGYTGIQLGAAAGTVLGYAHVGSQTIVTDATDFKVVLDGIFALNTSHFVFV